VSKGLLAQKQASTESDLQGEGRGSEKPLFHARPGLPASFGVYEAADPSVTPKDGG
jgi:hypothetical protein